MGLSCPPVSLAARATPLAIKSGVPGVGVAKGKEFEIKHILNEMEKCQKEIKEANLNHLPSKIDEEKFNLKSQFVLVYDFTYKEFCLEI